MAENLRNYYAGLRDVSKQIARNSEQMRRENLELHMERGRVQDYISYQTTRMIMGEYDYLAGASGYVRGDPSGLYTAEGNKITSEPYGESVTRHMQEINTRELFERLHPPGNPPPPRLPPSCASMVRISCRQIAARRFRASFRSGPPAGSVSRRPLGTLLDRNAVPVSGEPGLERLHRGVERPGEFEAAGSAENRFEVPLELEHVSEILRAREGEIAVDLGGHVVIPDLLPQRLGKRGRHLTAGQVIAGDADGLADELPSLPEYGVGAFSDVLRGDAGEFPVAHGKGDIKIPVLPPAHPLHQ